MIDDAYAPMYVPGILLPILADGAMKNPKQVEEVSLGYEGREFLLLGIRTWISWVGPSFRLSLYGYLRFIPYR